MKKNEYIAKVLPDGHLSLPPDLANRLNLKVNSKIRILIIPDTGKNKLSRFCGKWDDDRDAEDMVTEIYSERNKNPPSNTKNTLTA